MTVNAVVPPYAPYKTLMIVSQQKSGLCSDSPRWPAANKSRAVSSRQMLSLGWSFRRHRRRRQNLLTQHFDQPRSHLHMNINLELDLSTSPLVDCRSVPCLSLTVVHRAHRAHCRSDGVLIELL